MKIQTIQLLLAVLVLALTQLATAAVSCDVQRQQYPNKWEDTSQEQRLYFCSTSTGSAAGTAFVIKLGLVNSRGEALMSLVHQIPRLEGGDLIYKDLTRATDVFRIWVDQEQAKRLREGRYFSTVLRSEESCFQNGDFQASVNFRIDVPDASTPAGLSPRFSMYQSESVICRHLNEGDKIPAPTT